jgi:hypothetical protein
VGGAGGVGARASEAWGSYNTSGMPLRYMHSQHKLRRGPVGQARGHELDRRWRFLLFPPPLTPDRAWPLPPA